MVFCCHFGNSVEKTAVILSHLYVIGLKIVLREYAHLQVMGNITGKFHQNPLKTVGEVAETRPTDEKLSEGHNSGKNQLSMTSIKYAHLQVMGTITGKFHQNPLKTVGGVAETRLWLRTDGRTNP